MKHNNVNFVYKTVNNVIKNFNVINVLNRYLLLIKKFVLMIANLIVN